MVKLSKKKNDELGDKAQKILDKTIKALNKLGDEYNVEFANATIIKDNNDNWLTYTFSK